MLEGIGRALSLLIPINLFSLLNRISDESFSYRYKRRFKTCGSRFLLRFPFYLVGEENISIGDSFRSFPGLRLEAIHSHLGRTYSPSINIGDNVSINHNCHIGGIDRIEIGSNVLIASRVFITDHMHGDCTPDYARIAPGLRQLVSRGPVIIEDDVWLGEGVCVMPGVRIGKGAVIGANAVVTKDVPRYGVAIGVPAKTIRCYEK